MCLVGQSLIATPVILLNYSLHFCSFCEDASFTREGNFKACFDHKDIKIKKKPEMRSSYISETALCADHLLIRWVVVRSPADSVRMLKYPWARR